MDPNNHVARKHLPHQASISDDIKNEESTVPRKVKLAIERGVLNFMAWLAQKRLQLNGERLSRYGSKVEMCLNVLANKNNFYTFMKNLLRGKVVVPDKYSASYLSIIGLMYDMVDLDNNIKPTSNKYLATLCAMASKLAYENREFIKATVEKRWEMTLLGAYNFWDESHQEATTQAFIFRQENPDSDKIIVAFRGTEPFNARDWMTDFDISWYELQGIKGRVHEGFMKALGLKLDGTWPNSSTKNDHQFAYSTILLELKRHLETNPRTKFIVTGHSLGGALAVLFPAVLALHDESRVLGRLEAVYTFGQPRVGDEKFCKFMKEQFESYGVGYYRFVYNHDAVPKVPPDSPALAFKHFGTCIHVNSLYKATVTNEESIKNGFDCGTIVTSRVDALWELVRSFLMPWLVGPDYKEGLLLKMFRVVGLLSPDLTNHGLQDYINATRLAAY